MPVEPDRTYVKTVRVCQLPDIWEKEAKLERCSARSALQSVAYGTGTVASYVACMVVLERDPHVFPYYQYCRYSTVQGMGL